MKIFCDTSALIKKYINEKGSDKFDAIMNATETVFVSAITEIEIISAYKRLCIEHAISKNDFDFLIKELEVDCHYYSIIPLDDAVVKKAITLVNRYQLKTLDSIQLGTAIYIKDEIDSFVVCDEKLCKAAAKEKMNIINPNK